MLASNVTERGSAGIAQEPKKLHFSFLNVSHQIQNLNNPILDSNSKVLISTGELELAGGYEPPVHPDKFGHYNDLQYDHHSSSAYQKLIFLEKISRSKTDFLGPA